MSIYKEKLHINLIDGRTNPMLKHFNTSRFNETDFINDLSDYHGIEALETGTSNFKAVDWFVQTGKAYSTGYTRNGFIAAVWHPEIGIGVANSVSLTKEDMFKHLRLAFSVKGQRREQLLEYFDTEENILKRVVKPLNMTQRGIDTIGIAINEFRKLPHNGNPEDYHVMVSGLRSLDYQSATRIGKDIRDYLNKKLQIPGGQVETRLGEEGAIVYGGTTHPIYNMPAVYLYELNEKVKE